MEIDVSFLDYSNEFARPHTELVLNKMCLSYNKMYEKRGSRLFKSSKCLLQCITRYITCRPYDNSPYTTVHDAVFTQISGLNKISNVILIFRTAIYSRGFENHLLTL